MTLEASENTEVCEKVLQPNALTYFDGEGKRRQIHIPHGMFEISLKHFENKDWAELAKFEDYTGQQYGPNDFVLAEEAPTIEGSSKITETESGDAKDKAVEK